MTRPAETGDRPVPAAREMCTCGRGEAEDDRAAVLRCPVHGQVPAVRKISEEVSAEQAVSEALYELSRGQQWPGRVGGLDTPHVGTIVVARTAIEALRPHLARLLVESLGGEEAVVERMARAAYPELWQLREHALADSTLQIRRDAAMERVTRGLRSLMEDTPDG